MDDSRSIVIGRLSKDTATKVETIRYYERVGLLPTPARSEGGYRLYRIDHLKRLNFIRRARTLGFSIDEIRTLLRLADERRRPCAEVRVVAEAHLKDVRAKIADLTAMAARVEGHGRQMREGDRRSLSGDRGALPRRPSHRPRIATGTAE